MGVSTLCSAVYIITLSRRSRALVGLYKLSRPYFHGLPHFTIIISHFFTFAVYAPAGSTSAVCSALLTHLHPCSPALLFPPVKKQVKDCDAILTLFGGKLVDLHYTFVTPLNGCLQLLPHVLLLQFKQLVCCLPIITLAELLVNMVVHVPVPATCVSKAV